RSEPIRPLANVLCRQRLVRERGPGSEELDGALDGCVDWLRSDAVPALDEGAKLVDHRAVAACLENVQQRLRGEDLPDGGGERRPSRLAPHATDLLEHLEEPVGGGVGPQMDV